MRARSGTNASRGDARADEGGLRTAESSRSSQLSSLSLSGVRDGKASADVPDLGVNSIEDVRELAPGLEWEHSRRWSDSREESVAPIATPEPS